MCQKGSCPANVWVAPGQKAAPRQKVRWAPRCQVWGAVGVGWRHLVILDSDSSVTSMSYIETLKKVPFPMNCMFQQDGAKAHTAHASKYYITSRMKDVLKNWPPNSPELSPIENVWSMVQEHSRLCDGSRMRYYFPKLGEL